MGTEREPGGWARPRIWVSARDAVLLLSPHPGPVLSCASHPRPAEQSNELSGVGRAAQSNLGPIRLAVTASRPGGRGRSGTQRLALGVRGSPSRQHGLAGGGSHVRGSAPSRGTVAPRSLGARDRLRDTCSLGSPCCCGPSWSGPAAPSPGRGRRRRSLPPLSRLRPVSAGSVTLGKACHRFLFCFFSQPLSQV